jgi:hypothetical protein
MGVGAVGVSLSLIAPAEDKAHSKILQALQVNFSKILLDGRLLSSAQERVNLASKVVVAADKEHRLQSHNQWFREKANEAELELDEDMLEDDTDLPEMEESERREARRARTRLAQLLTEPMTTQRYGKFLSTNSAAMQDEIKPMVASVQASGMSRQKKKRKVTK